MTPDLAWWRPRPASFKTPAGPDAGATPASGDGVSRAVAPLTRWAGSIASPDLAILLLRVLLGVDWIAHAFLKVERGMSTHAALLARHGLPSWLAWPTFSIEVVGGISLILGLYVRQWSMVLLVFLMAVVWFKWPVGWIYSNRGGGWEYPLFWLGVQLALILLTGTRRDASR